ncbi:MAG: tRNA pseudouridine(55) synthase TruB [Firmicutes bacterium]|nr:tRNA pseudouridine(55) synthase TruB [Bacillota bacterium]
MYGFLNVLKPPGMTSHDLVAFLRKLLKMRKIGHSGTLDPNAAGVMVLALGQATRLLEYLKSDTKKYIGLIRLGITTDTYDADGIITSTCPEKKVSLTELEEVVASFQGVQEQKPPLVSAIRVNGKRLYQYARSGQEVEVPTRQVEITEIRIKPLSQKKVFGYNDLVRIAVTCSKGTYIRSLAHDIGVRCGLGAHLAALLRTESDGFAVADTLTLDELQAVVSGDFLADKVVPPHKVLGFPVVELSSSEAGTVVNGNQIRAREEASSGTLFSLVYNERLLAVAEYRPGGRAGILQPVKVMPGD